MIEHVWRAYCLCAIITHSWLETALEYWPYIETEFKKKILENKEMVFQNGGKSIQAAAYNGVHGSILFWDDRL